MDQLHLDNKKLMAFILLHRFTNHIDKIPKGRTLSLHSIAHNYLVFCEVSWEHCC
jgi:hypothetical protein